MTYCRNTEKLPRLAFEPSTLPEVKKKKALQKTAVSKWWGKCGKCENVKEKNQKSEENVIPIVTPAREREGGDSV